MSIISLTTDRRSDDFFVGRVKGEIAKLCPSAHVIDLAHNLPHFNIDYASFIIRNSYANFPAGTIHLIGIDSEEGPGQSHLIAKAFDQYFICADNGIISLIFDGHEITEIYQPISSEKERLPAMLRFVLLAQKIINSQPSEQFLKPVAQYKKKLSSRPVQEESLLLGRIIYIDSYQNAITNISRSLFEESRRGRKFIIYAGSMSNKIYSINKTHLESQHGELLAIFNSMDLLEISINKGAVMSLLNLKLYTEIRIEFSQPKTKEHPHLF
jgi:S-adenosylmethionine hydrolase